MAQLIDYLLQLSRISRAELHLQPVDLGEEAARIAEEIQRRDPRRRVCFAIAKPVRALADRRLIHTVLENLLDNAWKFTSGRDDASIEFGTAPSEDAAVCCYVRDNGAGFDPAYAGKLFQPFQRLHAARDFPGAGTGLASRAADRGTPWRPGLGRGRRRSGRDFLLHPGREGKRMTSQTIVLVEDNPDDEALTLRAFKKSNISNEVVVMRDGAEALAYLFPGDGDSDGAPRPALILLDLNLPKVGGLEVLRRMRADERTRLIPVVVLTSSKLEEDILDSYRNGANAYVRKPVNFSDFAEAVRTLGVFWLLLNEPAPSLGPESD